MTISINIPEDYRTELTQLKHNLTPIQEIGEDKELSKRHLDEIYHILNNTELKILCRNILKNRYLDKFSYEDLAFMEEIVTQLDENLRQLKDKIDVAIFFESGNIINIKKLKKKFRAFGLEKKFPNFDFKRLKELFEHPPESLPAMDGSNPDNLIIYDKFVVRKYLYGIVQMTVNEMDLLVGYTGSEGMGKSCGCSQDINLMYYLLKELKLIDYDYDITNMMFGSLNDFIQAEDKFFEEKFRILGLDEGNELNRQDWQDENVRTFFQRLRRERYNQRIKFICLPQLGELLTQIVLSRMNFIFNMWAKDDIETGTLDKGFCSFYIVPRTEKIYSPAQKREISKGEIINALGVNLSDKKEYLKEIPQKLLIKKITKNYIWGFNKNEYDKHIKHKNKTFSVNKGIKLTEAEAFYYFKCRPNLKEWNVDRKEQSEMYATLNKLDRKICKIFEDNPDKLLKWEKTMEYKKKRKARTGDESDDLLSESVKPKKKSKNL